MNTRTGIVAYFDTNIFDNILKKTAGVLEDDMPQLLRAIESRRLAIVTSILNISETMDARRPEIVLSQLNLIARLADRDRFVKPHDLVLTDDIKHFAWNGEPGSPFIREPMLGELRTALDRILRGQETIRDFEDVIQQNENQKARFLDGISDVRSETYPQIQELREGGEVPSFERYLADQSERVARAFARRVGVENECERLGLANLLKVRSVALTVGLSLSFIYRAAVEGKIPDRGASRDLQQAPPAAASADVFVTHDRELWQLLRRVPMKKFKILTLRDLLNEIG